MLHHIVMWRFAEEADGHDRKANIDRVLEAARVLPERIPELRAFAVHRDLGLDPAGSCDLCLVSEFEDAEALERYRVHPEHKAFASLVARVRESRSIADYID